MHTMIGWEFDQATDNGARGSRHETRREEAKIDDAGAENGTMVLQIAVNQQMGNQRMGTGVVATNNFTHSREVWALTDRSTGNLLLDHACAVRMVLAKACQKQWRKVNVQVHSQQLIRQLASGNVRDIRLATLIEDIKNLSSLFML